MSVTAVQLLEFFVEQWVWFVVRRHVWLIRKFRISPSLESNWNRCSEFESNLKASQVPTTRSHHNDTTYILGVYGVIAAGNCSDRWRANIGTWRPGYQWNGHTNWQVSSVHGLCWRCTQQLSANHTRRWHQQSGWPATHLALCWLSLVGCVLIWLE